MLTDLRLAFYEPDGIVMNPANAEAMELTKASTAGTYLGVYDPVAMRVWRVPVVETAAMTAGTALAGQFRLGATIWDRMATQIFTGQPNDFFLRNAFAILAELRAAFAVTRPLAFEKATSMP
jgi:HK97 family phage major capsid protein